MTKRILRYLCALMYGKRKRAVMETPKFPNGYHGEINDAWLASQKGASV